MSCARSTSSRSAWRTRTSWNGGMSTRMVNGTIPPPFDGIAFTPLALSSVAICGPSSVPAAWIWPVCSASASDTVLAKSRISRVSA